MRILPFLTLVLLALCSSPASHASDSDASQKTLFKNPTISRAQIAFAYAGDLWIVSRYGGPAKRLTSGVGVEDHPRFSPDGSSLAFSGEYDGNVDVFVISAVGGVPQRRTYHPGRDEVVAWSPSGDRVLFRSSRRSTANYSRLFTIETAGGALPEALPLPFAFEGSLTADGSRIAYQPISQWQPHWKRHRGGQTGRIRIADLSDSSVSPIPGSGTHVSNDVAPAWFGESLFFVSDRSGAATIFRWDPSSDKVAEVLQNDGLDVKSMSVGPDAIVYEQFGAIFVLDPATGASSRIEISVESDFPGVRARHEKVADHIQNSGISPTGARAVFEARGEIITVPAEKGDPRNLTGTAGVMERDPAWSPDGKWIAYFSDQSGEYALHIVSQAGSRDGASDGAREIDLGSPPSFYYAPVWSPDSTKIAYSNRRLQLWYLEVETGSRIHVDTNPIGFSDAVLQPAWSPDSKWLAYSRHLPNLMRAIFVFSLDDQRSRRITDGLSDAALPSFDRNGSYLYFAASTDIGRALSWADLSGIDHTATRSVYAVVLSKDQPSPLAPESDEENGEDPEELAETDDDSDQSERDGKRLRRKEKKGPKTTSSEPLETKETEETADALTQIDFEAVSQRIVALPIPAADIRSLHAAKEDTLFVASRVPATTGENRRALAIGRFDLKKRKLEPFLSDIDSFEVAADGNKVLYLKENTWTIAASDGELKPGEGSLATSAMSVRIEPRAEWRQMFHDAWRGERDHFYDPGHHGLDLEAAKSLYSPYLGAVAHREDLTYLFREMLNQLTIGHMFVRGGDSPRADPIPGGLLGCDFELENGRYKFARVFDGENWNPDLRAPLTGPGVGVGAGDYLLAVDGHELAADTNVYGVFENTAGTQVSIRVGPSPDGAGARDVIVVPVRSEAALRNRAWIEDNRRRVDDLSDGRLAYIYIPNTGRGGHASFNRYFFAQTDKQGAVVDERFNQGGLLADYVANYLSRPQLSAISFRYAEQDIRVPGGAIYGPKAMLINSMAGSGGDAMPWYFRKMKVGPLIGTRTWGGLVSSSPGPSLMDGGRYTAPDAAVYGLDGKWEVENVGVPPDIEVELDPALWRQGRDLQLETAVEYLLEQLEAEPQVEPRRPDYPTYSRCCGLDRRTSDASPMTDR